MYCILAFTLRCLMNVLLHYCNREKKHLLQGLNLQAPPQTASASDLFVGAGSLPHANLHAMQVTRARAEQAQLPQPHLFC